MKKTTRILKEIPRYTLELAETGTLHEYGDPEHQMTSNNAKRLDSLYDLKLENEYLSLLDNGTIIFTPERWEFSDIKSTFSNP